MKKIIFVLLLFIQLIFILSSCSNDYTSNETHMVLEDVFTINTNQVTERDNLIAFIDRSIIGVDFNARLQNEYLIYRLCIDTNERVDIGAIQNFVMTYGRPVVYGDYMYLFVASSENNELKNNLHLINLNTNEMKIIYTSYDDNTLTPISIISGNLYFLGINNVLDENIVFTHISRFDMETKQPISVITKYLYNSVNGEMLVKIAAYNDKMYLLTMVMEDNVPMFVVDVYNETYNLVKRLYLDETLGDIHNNQRITKFYVVGAYVFIRTTSQGILGKIHGDKITAVMIDTSLDKAFDATNEFDTFSIFYVMRTSDFYILNHKYDTLEKQEWKKDDVRVIRLILSNSEGYIIHSFITDESGIMQNLEIMYVKW